MEFMGIASAAALLLAGWLIGATGIGGVLVVPALTQFEGLPLKQAIAASALAFAFPGAAALWWLRRAPGAGASLIALVAGAVPGAAVGALLVHSVDVHWLFTAMAALAITTAVRGLRSAGSAAMPPRPPPPLSAAAMAALGLAVGLGSGLTGTGGPVLLVPLLMLWRQPLHQTVAAAQAIQLPVALCATATHSLAGAMDWWLACTLGLLLLAGSLAGQWASQRMALGLLQKLVAVLLLVTGLWFAWRAST